ncbi:hypothetical protein LT330_007601 [Penicillium expansum]|nr:hypothetical protein LT330_007601 [Penicillium expansum]
MVSLVAFDLDRTLALSKQPRDNEMAEALASLLQVAHVAIISGGDWPQFEKQIAARLPPHVDRSKLFLLPTTGTKLYTFSSESMNETASMPTSSLKLKNPSFYPPSMLRSPQQASAPKKPRARALKTAGARSPPPHLAKKHPLQRKKSEIRTLRRGRRLSELSKIALEEIMFIGDAIFPGGNDYPAFEMGLKTVKIKNPDGTLAAIAGIVACILSDTIQPAKWDGRNLFNGRYSFI